MQMLWVETLWTLIQHWLKLMILMINIVQDDWLLTAQLKDTKCKQFVEVLKGNGTTKSEQQIRTKYRLKNGRLYRVTENGDRWVVPRAARHQFVFYHHDLVGHFSVEKTFSTITKLFWFPSMRKYIRKYINCCLSCQYNKKVGGRWQGYLHTVTKIPEPFDMSITWGHSLNQRGKILI